MSRRVRFRPEIEGDLVGALEWYEGGCVGLGVEFLRAFDAAVALVTRNPAASRKVHG